MIQPGMQVRSSELEAELDSVRDEANRRISQLDSANQQQQSELHSRCKQMADLEGKLHSRSGALADHSERAKQLQQVCKMSQADCQVLHGTSSDSCQFGHCLAAHMTLSMPSNCGRYVKSSHADCGELHGTSAGSVQ